MLTPSYLAGLPDEMVKIYSQLEADIACDMARRVSKLGKVTDIAKWQMMILDELGSLKSAINKALTKYNAQAQKELKKLFEEAIQKSAQKDLAQYNKAHLSDNQKQILEATVMKLSDGKIAKGAATTDIINNQFKADYEGLVRLTQTIASNAESRFVEECNSAYMKVASGAFDYDSAIKQSVNSLAKNDKTSVNYNYKKETRSLSIEAAVRMNVMTGINQTCAEITERNCEDLGVELVEVDAHEGARPEHAAWQGKVYVRGKAREVDGVFYDSFEEVCKPGTATGICGINCRHSYYPYFPGMEKHYDGKDLKEMNKKDVEYNGKLMTKYEARQKQRAIERKIRQWKRTADIQKAGGVDDTSARVKLGEWQKIAQDFTDKTGLKRDYEREYIGTKSGKQPKALFESKTVTGGKKKDPFEENIRQENFANTYYNSIRNRKSESDVKKVAQNSGFSVEDVKQIRNHVFKEEHDLGNGYKELFAPAADIAHAWQRLEQGNPTEIDKILLGHELTELTLIKKYGYSQEKAHLEADKLYPWEYKLKKGDLTDDDIQKDIRERLKNLLQS